MCVWCERGVCGVRETCVGACACGVREVCVRGLDPGYKLDKLSCDEEAEIGLQISLRKAAQQLGWPFPVALF